jgi:hypothetical protein
MGMFKQMKDMKQVVAAAPAMMQEAQYLQANAMQMQAQQASVQQSVMARQAAAANHPAAQTDDMLAPIAGVTVEQYVHVVKGIAAYNYDQAMCPTIAAGLGISAENWAVAAEGFNARVCASPAFAQHFNRLYRGV